MAGDNTQVLQEDLDNAAGKMASTKSDLDGIISKTVKDANTGLDASIKGDVRNACIELIQTWQQKTSAIVGELEQFRSAMLSMNQSAGDEAAAGARSVSSIDFGRLG